MSGSALYYPYIRPRNDVWLLETALLWDKIYRLVPSEYDPADSEVARGLEDSGILVSLDPATESTDFQRTFLKMLVNSGRNLTSHTLSLNQLELHDGDWSYASHAAGALGYHGDPREQLSWVHATKFGEDIAHQLFEHRLGVARGAWIGVNDQIAEVFMGGLATRIARSHGLDAVTDDADAHTFAGEWTPTDLVRALRDRTATSHIAPRTNPPQLGLCAIELVVPSPKTLNLDMILKLRQADDGAFGRFRKRLSDVQPALIRALDGVDQPAAATRIVSEVCDQELGEDLRRLREMLRWYNIEATTQALGVSIPASSLLAIPFVAAGLPVIGATVAGVAGIGQVALRLVGGRRKARRESPASYLMDIENSLHRAD